MVWMVVAAVAAGRWRRQPSRTSVRWVVVVSDAVGPEEYDVVTVAVTVAVIIIIVVVVVIVGMVDDRGNGLLRRGTDSFWWRGADNFCRRRLAVSMVVGIVHVRWLRRRLSMIEAVVGVVGTAIRHVGTGMTSCTMNVPDG